MSTSSTTTSDTSFSSPVDKSRPCLRFLAEEEGEAELDRGEEGLEREVEEESGVEGGVDGVEVVLLGLGDFVGVVGTASCCVEVVV